MKRLETVVIMICLLFVMAISLYHVSSDGYLGLSEKSWYYVWIISENGLLLTMSFLMLLYSTCVIRKMFSYLFIPYFSLKLIYHFTCIAGIYVLSPAVWESVWVIILILLVIAALIFIITNSRHA